jgi:hypothetical protein
MHDEPERQLGDFTPKSPIQAVTIQVLYYSFTMSAAQCAEGQDRRILAECVQDASPGLQAHFEGLFSRKTRLKPERHRQRFLNANCRY